MFIQVNDAISLLVDDIVLILDKGCFNSKLCKLKNIEIVDYVNDKEEDIKSYIIARDENSLNDKGIDYKLYRSTKSSLSLLNKFNKLEEWNG